MPRVCVYQGCPNKDRKWSPYRFHRFPWSLKRSRLWLLALNMDLNTPTETLRNLRVCSAHFKEDDYAEDKMGSVRSPALKSTAMPTPILSGHITEEQILEASRQYLEDTQNTPVAVRRRRAPQQKQIQKLANKPPQSTVAYIPSIEVSLETDTEAFRKNVGVMTRPCVKNFGTNTKNCDLHVARDCLLQLFQVCGMCGFGTNAQIKEEMGRFSVIQECQICSHQREWWSHSTATEAEVKETVKGKRVCQLRSSGKKHT